jgi:hypothetical protein
MVARHLGHAKTCPDGEEIRGYSMGVALRLEELVKYTLEGNPVGMVTLEF